MRKSLSDFASENIDNLNKDNNNNIYGTPITDDNLQKAKDVINKYSAFDEAELIQEIKEKVRTQKELGLFDKNKLLTDIEAFSSFITSQQLSQIKELIEEIDAEN